MYECCSVTNVTRATRRGFFGAADTGFSVATGRGFCAIEAAAGFLSTAGGGLRPTDGGGRAGTGSGSGDPVKCHPRKPQKTRNKRSVGGILNDRTSILKRCEIPDYHSADVALAAKYVRAEGLSLAPTPRVETIS
jgi:hypothetical protein